MLANTDQLIALVRAERAAKPPARKTTTGSTAAGKTAVAAGAK
jgi:hypothetical protein